MEKREPNKQKGKMSNDRTKAISNHTNVVRIGFCAICKGLNELSDKHLSEKRKKHEMCICCFDIMSAKPSERLSILFSKIESNNRFRKSILEYLKKRGSNRTSQFESMFGGV